MEQPTYEHIPMSSPENDIKTHSMPSNLDAEHAILSSMLISDEVRTNVFAQLTEDDFYLPANRILFTAMRERYEQGQEVAPIALVDYLKSTDRLERAGGYEKLMQLGNNIGALGSVEQHVEILHRDKMLRKLITASAEISRVAYSHPQSTTEAVDTAEKLILNVTNNDVKDSFVSIGKALEDLYGELEKQAASQDKTFGVKTGFPHMDDMLLGLRKGQMVVVGARPGVGKTSFALNLAVQAAATGSPVVFFSLEMSAEEIAQRLVSSVAQIPLTRIRSADIKNDEWQAIIDATESLSKLDLRIDATPGTTVTEMRAKARRALHGKKNGLVIIDYLQLVSPPSGRYADSRATEVSEMSRGIKIMAKDLEVPVVALSQLSRGVEQRNGKRPQLSDLRESGAIEQDADIVILLDRSFTEEEAERSDRPDEGITDFIIAKNRSGPLGVIKMVFLAQQTKFREIDFTHSDE